MPIPSDKIAYIDTIAKGRFIGNEYKLTHEVARLQKDYEFIKYQLDYVLATLSLECNRENLRRNDGLEELFKLVDDVLDTIKKREEEEVSIA